MGILTVVEHYPKQSDYHAERPLTELHCKLLKLKPMNLFVCLSEIHWEDGEGR